MAPTRAPGASAILLLGALVLGACGDTGGTGGGGTGGGGSGGGGGSATTGGTGGGGSATTGGAVTECGPVDLDPPNVAPDDPADPAIVAACQALCDAKQPICQEDVEACVDACRLQACDICPGTLALLASCEAESFEAAACSCEGGRAVCDTPAACTDQADATYQCGG